jgi:hypothetical protein
MASGALGLGFGVVAILVHSAADFGQHVPAVAALTAVSCALLINLAHATARRRDAVGYEPAAARVPRRWRVAATLVVLVVACAVVLDAAKVLRASAAFAAARGVAQGLERTGRAATATSPSCSSPRRPLRTSAGETSCTATS